VGTESECEFIDLRIDRDISCREIKDRLNRELTNEMQILEAYEPTSKFQDIGWANYEIEIQTPLASPETAQKLQALYTGGNLIMTKKTKSGDKEIDIAPMIRRIKVTCDLQRKNTLHISAMLSAGSTEHLNPEMLIKLARMHCGILNEDNVDELYSILRTKVFLADGEKEFR
jgi:radical SAM-linked protein